MRFMILVRASPGSEAGAMPTEKQIAEQLAFHQAIDEAGALIDAMGFHPTSKAWRVVQRLDGSREVIGAGLRDRYPAGPRGATLGRTSAPRADRAAHG